MLVVIILCFLPGLIVASTFLIMSLGPKRSLSLIAKYPGTILLPVFTPLTFGPQLCLKCCSGCQCTRGSTKLQLSIWCTVVNVMVTSAAEFFAGFQVHAIDIPLIYSCLKLAITLFFVVYLRLAHRRITMNQILYETTNVPSDNVPSDNVPNTPRQ